MAQLRARAISSLAVAALFTSILIVGGQQPAFASHNPQSGSGQYPCTSTTDDIFGGGDIPAGCTRNTDFAPYSDAESASVTLPSTGGNVSQNDFSGARSRFGPAIVFGGRWPANCCNPAPASGPMKVKSQGTTGTTGSVTSSAEFFLDNATLYPGSETSNDGPGGIGNIVEADEVHSTCTASRTSLTGAATFVNGVVLASVNEAGYGSTPVVIPNNAPPNLRISGEVTNVGDHFTVIVNEQIIGPNSITVNAVHMYMHGPVAVGHLIIGQVTCGVTATATSVTAVSGNAVGYQNEVSLFGSPEGYRGAAVRPILTPLTPAPRADFDGDNDTDVAVYRPGTNSSWFLHGKVTNCFTSCELGTEEVDRPVIPWGTTGDIPVPADYRGYLKNDAAVFRPSTGTWFISGQDGVPWGTAGDIPVPGNYDGNHGAEMAVFRPSNGTWFVKDGQTVPWGTSGDIPVPADYDGDGDTDIAVFRPSTRTWYVQGGITANWGTSGDIPVPGDYDGDGDADIAVFRPSTGVWYVQGGASAGWGTSGDIPVPGDYDHDGDTDMAVFRPSNGVWYVRGGLTVAWGTSGDVPLALPDAIRRFFFPPL